MKAIFSVVQLRHDQKTEVFSGQIAECAEMPLRAQNILAAFEHAALGDVLTPKDYGLDPVLRVHAFDYVTFIQNAYADWVREGYQGNAFPTNFNMHGMPRKAPRAIEGKMGYYLTDTSIAITPTTWQAVAQSANTALTALDVILAGDRSAFALCRPPGHHASARLGGGYCFLNNVAIAAQAALDKGAKRVAILDVDYHHGNGTQDIFYERDDVLFCSLHADPEDDFPYYIGYADEKGRGVGEGYNHNYVLPLGTDWSRYKDALSDSLQKIADYAPDIVFISLGVDTFKLDPISKFKLESDDFIRMGQALSRVKCPVGFVMEGGYAIDHIGVNVTNVLKGYTHP